VTLIRIIIPSLPPAELSPNHSNKIPPYAIWKAKSTWQEMVWYSALQYRGTGFKKASLTITCVVRDKRFIKDPDNFLASMKSCLDILTGRIRGANRKTGNPGVQGLNIIADDSPECLEIRMPIKWITTKKEEPKLILEIQEL
jgi:hypothetical protein